MTSLPDDAKVLGMEVSKLQSDVTVDSDNTLHGISRYVKGFDAYDKDAEGNFIAMRVTAPSDATVKITTSTVSDEPMDEDRTVIWKVTATEDTLTVKVEKGEETAEAVYRASGLTLEQQSE